MAQYHPDPEINQDVLNLLEKIKKYCESQTSKKAKDLTHLIIISTIPETNILFSENGVDYPSSASDITAATDFALKRRRIYLAAVLEKNPKK